MLTLVPGQWVVRLRNQCKPLETAANVEFPGALLTEVPKDDDPSSLRFAGSTLVCMAESKEEIIEMLKKDIYGESGVWDIEKVCAPTLTAIRGAQLTRYMTGADVACETNLNHFHSDQDANLTAIT